jgi:2-methylcitrate dehydratase
MTVIQQIAAFVKKAGFSDLSPKAGEQIKLRILDSLGTAIGAVEGAPLKMIRAHVRDFSHQGRCTLIGGGSTSPDLAALYNSALVRYLDFNDSYPAKGETCHPSDNLGAVLAAGDYAQISGKELMLALAVAYQVHCRLSDAAPVRSKGFDHTTQGAYSVAAGVSKALNLDPDKAANAMAISATALNALRVTRTGQLSHWKGLAFPYTAFGATTAVFLAMRGITGPLEVIEGNKGFQETIAGPFHINWQEEDLERVNRTILKKFNAEVHSQPTLEGAIELAKIHRIDPETIEKVEIEIFDVAYHIIGGGEEGDKTVVHTKEQADHSLPYMTAVALLDGEVYPEQYRSERIRGEDVQTLLRKIVIRPSQRYSARFPDEMPSRLTIHLKDNRMLEIEKSDYEGFHSRPMNWETVGQKFEKLAKPFTEQDLRHSIIDIIKNLEHHTVKELTELLARVRIPDR